jgi:hypothetical protein
MTAADSMLFCLSHHSWETLDNILHEKPRRTAVSEILDLERLAPTIIPRSKSLMSQTVSKPVTKRETTWRYGITKIYLLTEVTYKQINNDVCK